MLVFFSIPVLWENICILNVRLGGETDQQNVIMHKAHLRLNYTYFKNLQCCAYTLYHQYEDAVATLKLREVQLQDQSKVIQEQAEQLEVKGQEVVALRYGTGHQTMLK